VKTSDCVQLRTSAVNATLPAFAAERRASEQPLLLTTGDCSSSGGVRRP